MVVVGELGPSASDLLEQHQITVVTVKPGISVAKAIELAKIEYPDLFQFQKL